MQTPQPQRRRPQQQQQQQQEPRPRPQQVPDISEAGIDRMQALELHRLNQEIRLLLEEELEKLDKTDNASVACVEFVVQIDSTLDPLLAKTKGIVNPGQSLNRWFEQPARTNRCCWIC